MLLSIFCLLLSTSVRCLVPFSSISSPLLPLASLPSLLVPLDFLTSLCALPWLSVCLCLSLGFVPFASAISGAFRLALSIYLPLCLCLYLSAPLDLPQCLYSRREDRRRKDDTNAEFSLSLSLASSCGCMAIVCDSGQPRAWGNQIPLC